MSIALLDAPDIGRILNQYLLVKNIHMKVVKWESKSTHTYTSDVRQQSFLY